jgi:DNA-binding YbaB/EbfC family protein
MFNMQKMMKQAQQMQQKMKEAQERLKATEFEGIAGGGMVKVKMTGDHITTKIDIDKNLVDTADEKETLEDLLIVALNDAKNKIADETASVMGEATGGLKLPEGMGF